MDFARMASSSICNEATFALQFLCHASIHLQIRFFRFYRRVIGYPIYRAISTTEVAPVRQRPYRCRFVQHRAPWIWTLWPPQGAVNWPHGRSKYTATRDKQSLWLRTSDQFLQVHQPRHFPTNVCLELLPGILLCLRFPPLVHTGRRQALSISSHLQGPRHRIW